MKVQILLIELYDFCFLNLLITHCVGSIMVKVGREEPAVSMDVNGGKIIWARHCELQQANLKALPEGEFHFFCALLIDPNSNFILGLASCF